MKRRNPKQFAQLLESMQLSDCMIKSKHINDTHNNLFKYHLQGISDKLSKLERDWYITKIPCHRSEITEDWCIVRYSLTDKWRVKGVVPIITYPKKSKIPSSSFEESIVKSQNKLLNDKEFVKYELFKKEFYFNEQEGKRERGTQFVSNNIENDPTIKPVRKSLFSKLKSLLSFTPGHEWKN
jgi:hypothetical protein